MALLGSTAGAREVAGVRFAAERTQHGATLELRNVALLRYAMIFDVYAAGLYVGRDVEIQRVLEDVPRRLEIEYMRGFDAAVFARSTRQLVRRNVGQTRYARLEPGVEAFNTLYRDVTPGDRYALTYVPGHGTELALNGVALGSLPGAELSQALFSIWLGARPFDAELKRKLLAVP